MTQTPAKKKQSKHKAAQNKSPKGRRLTPEEVSALIPACIAATVNNRTTDPYMCPIALEVPYDFEWPIGFPKGAVRLRKEATKVHAISAKRIMDWLRANGYTRITSDDIRVTAIAVTKLIGKEEYYNDFY